jgi:hypothetical protein
MREYQCPQEQVLKDLAAHEMRVIHDNGLHRHLRFRKPGSSVYWFDIITYPGSLVIDGDMGTYVFRRLDDMFEFFRTDSIHMEGDGLKINPSYWGEKLTAVDRHAGFREFSERMFLEAVKRDYDDWVEHHQPSEEVAAALWKELEEDVIAYGETEERAVESAMDFQSYVCDFQMRDYYEHNLQDFSFSFIWNCYAIAWAVKQYDKKPPYEIKIQNHAGPGAGGNIGTMKSDPGSMGVPYDKERV